MNIIRNTKYHKNRQIQNRVSITNFAVVIIELIYCMHFHAKTYDVNIME
jgi:hypothetical protein